MNDYGDAAITKTAAGDELVRHHDTVGHALAEQQRAEVQARFVWAERHPRDLDTVRVKLLKDCNRVGFADRAVYARPVGKELNEETNTWEEKVAEGLSIRFVETALQRMGNVGVQVDTISEDDSKRIVRVGVIDFEGSLSYTRALTISKETEKKAPQRNRDLLYTRLNSSGKPVYVYASTPEEMQRREGAEVSKMTRTLALRLIPADIADECLATCKAVSERGDQEDPEGRRKKLIDGFAALGVEPADLREYLGGIEIAKMQPAQLDHLRKVYTALKDGLLTWADALDGSPYVRREEGAAKEARAAADKVAEALHKSEARQKERQEAKRKAAEAAAAAAADEKKAEREPGDET